MRKGIVVEQGDAKAVLDNPTHPYSMALKNAVLPPDPSQASSIIRALRPQENPPSNS
jgi:peptide/nickel transport system ATP-binding protein